MLLILSIVFTIAGILFLKPICVFLGSSERLLTHVLPYAFVIFLRSIPMSFKLFFLNIWSEPMETPASE